MRSFLKAHYQETGSQRIKLSYKLFETKRKNKEGEQEELRMHFYIAVFYTQELVSPEPTLQAALVH